jgi:hypothetical protein
MSKADKLFQKAELEYITPFLKLWLAFNAWYKKDSEADNPAIKSDRDAINKYKGESKIKHYFFQFFESSSDSGKEFGESLSNIAIDVADNYELNNTSGHVHYTCVVNNPRIKNDKIKIGESSLFFLSTDKDHYYEETLEIIYAIRCALVHGDFDIENVYFNQLVRNAYKILYLIMGKVLE